MDFDRRPDRTALRPDSYAGMLRRAAWDLVAAIGPGRVLTLATVAALLGAVIAGEPHWPRLAPREPESTAALPRPEGLTWVPVARPLAMFAIDTPLFPREPRLLEARRHAGGGGREEIQTFGAPETGQGFARLVAYRPGSEAGPAGSLFLETARRAAEAGFAVNRSAVPVEMGTKFGAAETADVVLSRGANRHACIGWRILADDADLRLSGWMCGVEGRPADRLTLACALDRLDLIAAADDKAVRAYFARAERNRLPQCTMRGAPGARRAGWLDLEAGPELRLRSHS